MSQAAFLLPAILFLPLIGALLVMCIPREEKSLARGVGFGVALTTFLVSLAILGAFDRTSGAMQLVGSSQSFKICANTARYRTSLLPK